MATTVSAHPAVQMLTLDEIRTDRNVRQHLVPAEIDQLAQSIALLGQLSPVSVRPHADGGYQLIAGHKRHAALRQLGHATIRAEIRQDHDSEASERAAENIASCRCRHDTINADLAGMPSCARRGMLGWTAGSVTSA